jgi:hypothetical protein
VHFAKLFDVHTFNHTSPANAGKDLTGPAQLSTSWVVSLMAV